MSSIRRLTAALVRAGAGARVSWAGAALAIAAGGLAVTAGGLAVTAGPALASNCPYHRSGSHWVCITPGAYCPKAAHGHYGRDKYSLARKYWCEDNHGWRREPKK